MGKALISLISVDNDIISHGIRSISSYLKKNNHKTQLIFMPLGLNKNLYSDKILKNLLELVKNSDVVGVTSMTLTEDRAKQVISYLKKNNKKIVFGGVHPTIFPEESLEYAEIICRGDGENAMLELANNLKNKNINNLWFKDKKNPLGNLVENLDLFDVPDFDIDNHYILKKSSFSKFTEDLFNGMHSIHTTRGCPHSCTYCCNNFFRKLNEGKGKIMRKRSIKNVISELVMIKNRFKSIKRVWITDDTFLYRPEEELKEFAEEYKEKINLPFSCYISPKTTTEDKLKLLIDAGLNFITIGIQTGSDKINKNLYKRFSFSEDVLKVAEMLKKYQNKITVDYQIIVTNPYEKEEDLLNTISLLKKLPKPFLLETFNLSFYKGTELYEKALKDNIINNDKDASTDLHFYDLVGNLKRKKNVDYYLNSVLFSMNGQNTEKRYGFIPAFMLNFLINKKVIKFNNTFKLFTYLFNHFRKSIVFLMEIRNKRVVST